MKLEQQIITLAQAQRLKELGIEQKSLFYYESMDGEQDKWNVRFVDYQNKKIWDDTFSAFTVAELGVLLPSEEYTQRTGTSVYYSWEWVNDMNEEASGVFENEAAARADRLIKLLESGEETAEEVNQRLTLT